MRPSRVRDITTVPLYGEPLNGPSPAAKSTGEGEEVACGAARPCSSGLPHLLGGLGGVRRRQPDHDRGDGVANLQANEFTPSARPARARAGGSTNGALAVRGSARRPG